MSLNVYQEDACPRMSLNVYVMLHTWALLGKPLQVALVFELPVARAPELLLRCYIYFVAVAPV